MYSLLNIQEECGILNPAKRRRSILVRSAASEEGPKNPLKGIAVKPLVPAANAQFGVGAGREARTPRACSRRAFPNGMGKPTLRLWRPALVRGRTPFAVTRPVYGSGVETCIAVLPGPRAVNAVCRCSLPCVDMADRRTTPSFPGQGKTRIAP